MPASSRVLLIHVTGPDKPGLTYGLTSILARYGVRVLDIGQAVIHDALALGILVEMTDSLRASSCRTRLPRGGPPQGCRRGHHRAHQHG